MSNKNKKSKNKSRSEKAAKGKQLNSFGRQFTSKMNKVLASIGDHNKYKERIKTSYFSFLGYFILIYIFNNLRLVCIEKDIPRQIAINKMIPFLMAGIILCLFNISKHILSIKEDKKKTHNVILCVLQSLFLLFFAMCFGVIPG